MKKPAGYFLGEGLLIVFSILLALGLNEWRLRAGQEAEERKAVADLSAELRENRALLDGVPEYHQAVAQALFEEIGAMAEDDPRTPIEVFRSMDVLRNIVIIERLPQRVSWRLASDRGIIARFDYDEAKSLSNLYDNQLPSVTDLYDDISDLLVRPEMFIASNQRSALAPLALSFSELASREKTLVLLLDTNIAMLGGAPLTPSSGASEPR